MRGRFENKVAVMTGAGQGIGKRVAERMADEKGLLVLVDRAAIVHDVAEQLQGKTTVIGLTADLEKFAECQRVMAAAVAQFGRIDILVNRVNATAPGATDAPPRIIPRNTAEQSEQEKGWYKQIYAQSLDSSLMKRYDTLDEQADPILFLASDDASCITGTVLPVGGGDLG